MSTSEDICDGLLCQQCGVLMEDQEAPGYARTCDHCGGEVDYAVMKEQTRINKVNRLETFMNEVFPGGEWIAKSDYHFRYMVGNVMFDYWPSTMKVFWRGRTHYGIEPKAVMGFIANRKDR